MDDDLPIDPTFDMRWDAGGRDPDAHSPTLRRYHRRLWSKPLPSGQTFALDEMLRHQSDLGDYHLRSDAITHTYSKWDKPAGLVSIVDQVRGPELDAFYDLGCTIGGFVVFPAASSAGGRRTMTINQARGTHPRIRDRFDLTLESIRRHYAGEISPLSAVLERHRDFFDLFVDFEGYVEFFLLQDLVADDHTSVAFLARFDDFRSDPLPAASLDEYRLYMQRSMDFVASRNERIVRTSQSQEPRGPHALVLE